MRVKPQLICWQESSQWWSNSFFSIWFVHPIITHLLGPLLGISSMCPMRNRLPAKECIIIFSLKHKWKNWWDQGCSCENYFTDKGRNCEEIFHVFLIILVLDLTNRTKCCGILFASQCALNGWIRIDHLGSPQLLQIMHMNCPCDTRCYPSLIPGFICLSLFLCKCAFLNPITHIVIFNYNVFFFSF